MKAIRTILFTLIAAAAVGAGQAHAQTAKPTKDERRAERQRRITVKATEATRVKLKEGKAPSYNRLIKSTEYKLMYTEGLRYYRMLKKGKDRNSMANLRKAQTLFKLAVESQAFSGTPQGDSLYYYWGCSHFQSQDYQTSQDIFDNFRRSFGSSIFIEDVEYMFASGFYELSPDPKHDQSITLRAISAINEFLGRFPGTRHRDVCRQRLDELQRKLYSKSYENARLYYTIGQYKAAVRALGNAINEWPMSPYREELMYLATRSAYLFAKNSIPSQMTDRYLSMMDNYYNLISEYPETRHLREAEQMRDEARAHIEAAGGGQAINTTTKTNDGN